jgi:hypothetical protein
VLLDVWHSALACDVNLAEQRDPWVTVGSARQQVDKWLAANQDPLFQRRVRVRHASAMLQAVRSLQLRGEMPRAEQIAKYAAETVGPVAQQQPPHRDAELPLAHALFSIGAIFGVGQNDHERALTWYHQAEPLLVAPIPEWCFHRRVTGADQLVSIGLSHWSAGEKQRAIELTQAGLEQLQAAAANGRTPTSLAVALNNLAFMHGEVGNRDKAREYTELARKLDD